VPDVTQHSQQLYYLYPLIMKRIKFYFDAISPYAWLAWRPLQALVLKQDIQLDIVPVLFAGLLKANGQLGPAEIPN
jgi:2-hydroxychromene-2-carboxylate isomerase